MTANTERPQATQTSDVTAGILARVGTVVVFLVLTMAILFLTSGRLDWTWAWVFLAICLMSMTINGFFVLRTNPETVAERSRILETKAWDKVVGGLWALALYLGVPIVAGLDLRFGWTHGLTTAWNIAGAVALMAGLGLAGWAMIANAYFSTAVRIQSDRGHTVCRSGPYRFVRHPGYVGFVLQSLSTPVLLGSVWALILGVTAAVLMIIRTALEDRTLQLELSGYNEYIQDVRFRLVPGVW